MGLGHILVVGLEHIPHHPVHGIFIHLRAQQVTHGQNLVQRALQLPHVGGDILGNVGRHIVRQRHTQQRRLVFQNRQTRFKIRRHNIHHQAPFKTGAQTVLQLRHLTGRTVGSQHDLLAGFIQRVEGMEKFLLGLLFAGDKLNIVHQQQRRLTVFLAELEVFAFTDGGHQLVGKIVALDIDDTAVGAIFLHLMGNGVE